MAEVTAEKTACENCGVDVREGTTFCYNCGKPVVSEATPTETVHTSNGSEPAVSEEARAALDDLAARLKIEDVTSDDRRAQAAAERKLARVKARRNEIVWEPADGSSLMFIIATVLIFGLSVAAVIAAVYWK